MTSLQLFLKDSTAQAMKKEGIKGTFTYTFKIEFYEDEYFAIGSTLINELTGMVSFHITKIFLSNDHNVGDEFTVEVTNEG
ncbi:hypothetical protein [Pseudescherichia vulneris]|uniref:hypothetical protein n=1 Tax=Pseudescherichia vulneris TaxID=566 RepID=UPI001EDE0B03|nr:hypothetical protein [Pseudescherichia vulneris]